MNTDKLLQALSEGIVNIEFTSMNSGNLRSIPCTLNKEHLANHFSMKQHATSDNILVFRLDSRTWEDIRIDTIQKSVKELRITPGTIDAIICFYYVDREIVETLKKWLRPGGVIIFEAYTINQKLINKMEGEDSYVLQSGELLELFSDFTLLKYEEPLHMKDYIASIIAQKPPEKTE